MDSLWVLGNRLEDAVREIESNPANARWFVSQVKAELEGWAGVLMGLGYLHNRGSNSLFPRLVRHIGNAKTLLDSNQSKLAHKEINKAQELIDTLDRSLKKLLE